MLKVTFCREEGVFLCNICLIDDFITGTKVTAKDIFAVLRTTFAPNTDMSWSRLGANESNPWSTAPAHCPSAPWRVPRSRALALMHPQHPAATATAKKIA